MKLKEVHITIEGVSPLLCNRFTDAAQEAATSGTRAATLPNNGTPREQAEPKLYLDTDGTIGIPQPNLLRCFIDAGKYLKVGRSKVTTLKSSIVPSCVFINGTILPVIPNEWEVDTRPIVNPATGGRRLTHRPRFDEWGIDFVSQIDLELITPSFYRELVDVAGSRIGLGDFRPDRKGPFGRFNVTRWEVMAS